MIFREMVRATEVPGYRALGPRHQSSLNPRPQTLKLKLQTLNPEPWTLNLNPKP